MERSTRRFLRGGTRADHEADMTREVSVLRLLLPIFMLFRLLHLSTGQGSASGDGRADSGGDAGDGKPGDGQGDAGKPPAQDEPRFTQAELDRVAGQTRAEAKRKAEQDVANALGVPLDEAKAIIAERQQRVEAEKTEAQKATEAANKARSEADDAKKTAAQETLRARAVVALVKAKLNPDRLDRATVLLLADVDADADADAVDAAATKLAEETPEWFTGEAAQPPPANGNPGGAPPRGQSDAKGLDAGRKRSQDRRTTPNTDDDPLGAFQRVG